MSVENKIRVFAGSFIIISLVLSQVHSSNWLFFTVFVGLNLIQSAFTHFCPLEIVLKKMETKTQA